jgi:DnaK suppressor protein
MLDPPGQLRGDIPMPNQNTHLTQEFIEQQRIRLEDLRAQLLTSEQHTLMGEGAFQDVHGDEAMEPEERAQETAQMEIYQARNDADQSRMVNIVRALQKTRDGTYGLSDISGQPIPKDRLASTPEAVLTVLEECRKENA